MLTRFFSSATKSHTHLVGMSISASALHVVAIDISGDTPSLHSSTSHALEKGMAIGEQLSKRLASFDKLHCHVAIAIEQDAYQLVQTDKPDVPDEDIRTALPWTISEMVPFDASNMVLDYIDYPAASRGGKKKVNVFVAERAPMADIVAALTKLKAKVLTHIHVKEVLATSMMPDDEYARLLIIQEPGSEPFLLIVRSQVIWLARRLRGFVDKMQGQTDMTRFSDALGLEIQRSMDFYESQLKQPPLKEVLFKTQFDCAPVIEQLKPFQPAAMAPFKTDLLFSDVVHSDNHFALASALDLLGECQ